MVENKVTRDEEQVPIVPPLKVLDHKTINKRFGWWSAAGSRSVFIFGRRSPKVDGRGNRSLPYIISRTGR
jgi:hypothetical protein